MSGRRTLESGGLKMLAPPSLMVGSILSVRVKRGVDEFFVWEETELEATPERPRELKTFRGELTRILELAR